MSYFISLSIGLLLSLFYQVTCAESELRSKVVHELLSLRIDELLSLRINNVVRENKNLKSELKETKAVVYRLENKIESMEVNISLMASKAARYEEKNSKTLLNEKFQSFEKLSASRLQRKFKTEAIVLRKMLVNEKSHMKEELMAFEQKFKSVQAELEKNLNAMNTSVETTVGNLEKSISEHNITTNARLEAFEDKLQSQLNETDILVQEMNEDFENKLTESDKRIKEGNIKLVENINEVDQRLTAAKSNFSIIYNGLNNRLYSSESVSSSLQSTYRGLNNRLNSTESVSSSLQSTYRGLNNRLNSAESKLRSVSSQQDRQENTFSSQISALSSRISMEEARKVAFSAKVMKQQMFEYKHETIVFDTVLYSYGGGYNSSTGIFTAPKSGTYLFTYNIESFSSGRAHTGLYIDYVITGGVAAKGPDINGGSSGISYVWQGENVWVQTTYYEKKYYILPHRTTFNGILID